jgi:meso-butanediol dehydrogenase/(S,S)-butanediol dehydrogenase/diacetyl reductase
MKEVMPISPTDRGQRFAGKVALITGAASGIGRASALRLAAEGARVYACDLAEGALGDVVREIAARGGQADAHVLDVSQRAACFAALGACVARFGQLDVLANIAGIGMPKWERVAALREDDWRRTLAVNLDGVLFMTQAAIPHLLRTRGAIVNMASAAGLKGQVYTSAYCVSKAGVVSLTKCVALEYAKQGLRCVAICPGGVKTPLGAAPELPADPDMAQFAKLIPLMPLAEPEEIAAAVAYVASAEARFMNGAVLSIDGAQTAG